MSLDELEAVKEIESQTGLTPDDTISDIIDIYGAETVKRGLNYMEKLIEADENFKESANSSEYGENVAEGVVEDADSVSDETKAELQSEWEEAMKERGLGLDDE